MGSEWSFRQVLLERCMTEVGLRLADGFERPSLHKTVDGMHHDAWLKNARGFESHCSDHFGLGDVGLEAAIV